MATALMLGCVVVDVPLETSVLILVLFCSVLLAVFLYLLVFFSTCLCLELHCVVKLVQVLSSFDCGVFSIFVCFLLLQCVELSGPQHYCNDLLNTTTFVFCHFL